jgi:hypothetical protein
MIGPILFTQALATAIHARHDVSIPGAPFYVASLLILASFLWALRVAR